jgi:hypothetical protein
MTERETLLAEIAEKQARLAELDAPDPLLVEAREIAARDYEDGCDPAYAKLIRNGEVDHWPLIQVALAALRRGMEIAKAPPMGSGMELAERPTLTREMVEGAVMIADVQAMDVKGYVDTLHTALVERIK